MPMAPVSFLAHPVDTSAAFTANNSNSINEQKNNTNPIATNPSNSSLESSTTQTPDKQSAFADSQKEASNISQTFLAQADALSISHSIVQQQQHMSVKTSMTGDGGPRSFGLEYGSPSIVLDTSQFLSSAPTAAELTAALNASVATSVAGSDNGVIGNNVMPVTTSHSEFATAAATPAAKHTSTHSSPVAMQGSLVNHPSIPYAHHPPPHLAHFHSMAGGGGTVFPSLSAGIPTPATALPHLHTVSSTQTLYMAPRGSLPAPITNGNSLELVIDTHSAMAHSRSASLVMTAGAATTSISATAATATDTDTGNLSSSAAEGTMYNSQYQHHHYHHPPPPPLTSTDTSSSGFGLATQTPVTPSGRSENTSFPALLHKYGSFLCYLQV